MRVTTRARVGNIVTLMRIKPKRNRKPVATAMTSNEPSPANARERPGGSADSGSHVAKAALHDRSARA
jgi:hypothetical protein